MIRAGRLDQRVTIEIPVESRDVDYGTVGKSWTSIATVWASVEPGILRPRESEMGREVVAMQYTRVRCRWSAALAAVTPKARINLGGGRLLQVESVVNPRMASEELVFACVEYNSAAG